MQQFDAIVIGTGQAGPSLARRLAGEGRKVAVMERRSFGGTCVNTGCTPTKTMVASATVARAAQRAAEYGVTINGSVGIDMKKVKARKDAIVAQSTGGVERSLRKAGCTVFHDHARFIGPHEVSVNGETLTAKWIFINVGGRASSPPIEGLAGVDYLTNTSILELDIVPDHLAIIGGSYIGLEFGQMFRRFGSRVTIVEIGPRLINREDEDVSEAVRTIMENEGIDIRLNAKCLSVAKAKGGVTVNVDCADGAPSFDASHLLIATGRCPNTDDLGLDKAGIATDAKGFIAVDDQLRTNVEGIWALGDCNGKGAFTHTSYNDYEIVVANLLDNDPRRISDRIPAYALYIDPALGRAGMTDAEIRKSGRKALAARMPMEDVSRAVERGETQGFMKITVDAETKQILGAAVLGPGGDEIIHSVLDLIYAKVPYTVMQRAVHIHPTVSELIPTMLGELTPL